MDTEPTLVPAATEPAAPVALPTTLVVQPAASTPDEPAFASAEDLLGKAPRTVERTITVGATTRRLKMRAIDGHAYDELLSRYPANEKQRADGYIFNQDEFGPAILAACLVSPAGGPVLTLEQARQLWVSPAWSRGERSDLFFACLELCTAGLDVPFTAAG
jgi:hypothetical protein